MFTSIDDFAVSWKQECGQTQRIFNTLTDASLAQEVSPQDRTLGRIAWHLVTVIQEMVSRTGLKLEEPEPSEPIPATAKEIADQYAKTTNALLEAVQSQWTDQTLLEVKDMYGQSWPNGLTLELLISHQTHHRGQMTVLMRQAGLVVPGVYGPAREEWKTFMNMEAPAL
ncbi:DinB family protein [Paenibacillus cremeus]|uniref:Damage-inducible protein DinB n=1 Tax=Paenibacillus cremeus TaxID=2163881 RepID=A0A559KIC8_9BACL|nr:DinB family protein [Paenibacillus cremeus]TVY11876.1 hypothetical protein FPZ49_00865 [Paenibacillus cremeus]